MSDPILVWGAGAIGGTLGADWVRAGHDVVFVDSAADHVEAMRAGGLAIEGPVAQYATGRLRAFLPDELEGRFRRVVLATKAHHTPGAMRALSPHLAPDGFVLSAQNGLNELVIAEHVGAARTMGCFVNYGADWLAPGRILRGNRGAVVVGELDGVVRPRTEEMFGLLRIFEPDAVLTTNIWGYLYGKLGYGALLFATALTNASIADALASARHFDLWRRLGQEVMAVARAKGVRPRGFNGYDPDAFMPGAPDAGALASIRAMADFNRPGAKTHSGIWRDLAVRRRRTEVDAQIAVIGEIAAGLGIDTPAIRTLVALIHDVEEGRRPQAWETLDVLLAVCETAPPLA
jgi:2-dehydropantoate 2-reductase